MQLTRQNLKRLGACSSEDFDKVFPKGTAITLAALKKAKQARLDLWWLREALNPPSRLCSGSCRICYNDKRRHARLAKLDFFKALVRLFKRA